LHYVARHDNTPSPLSLFSDLSYSLEKEGLPFSIQSLATESLVTASYTQYPALLSSLRHGIERAVSLVVSSGQPAILQQADQLAMLLTGLIEPDVGLVEERMHRLQTIREIFAEEEWLTADMLNRLQPEPPSNRSLPASDWKRRGRIFSVTFGGKEYFPRYQFDAAYQPLPLMRNVLAALGTVADTWKIAAWFHYPNGWIAPIATDTGSPVHTYYVASTPECSYMESLLHEISLAPPGVFDVSELQYYHLAHVVLPEPLACVSFHANIRRNAFDTIAAVPSFDDGNSFRRNCNGSESPEV
jgi:hypothetical protein